MSAALALAAAYLHDTCADLDRVGAGGVMATMNQSAEAAASGIGGWYEGVTYQAGLSGGSWATTTMTANNGRLPTDLIENVRRPV